MESGDYSIERVRSDAPVRRCDDCKRNLGDVIGALCCPLFGMLRSGVEIRCLNFLPRKPGGSSE